MQLTVERCNITHVSVTIPPKILSNIFRQLRASDSTEDIKKLRLVCKAFSYAAAPFLIQTVFLSSSQQDLDVLKAVSAHAVFSKYVTDLVYDCRMFDEALTTDKAAYMEELRPQSLSAFNEGILITKRAAKESFQAYGRLFRQQKDCREGQLDMACLHEAFTKMPHLAHISIRGKPRPRLLPEYENVVHHPDRRFADLNVVLPRPRMSWRRDRQVNVHNEVCHHGVLDFLTTISSPNISKQLQSLSMGYPTDNEELRLCPELFDGSVVCVNSIGHLCKTLRKIQLTVRIGDDQDEAWPLFLGQLPISNDHLECQKRLCWALMFATGLECLHLTFNCARRQRGNEVQLNNILDKLKFPQLREFRLIGIHCKQRKILNFIGRHRNTLRYLTFGQVSFTEGTWFEFIDKMKTMDLNLITCELGLRLHPLSDNRQLQVVGSDPILEYLNGGNQNPLENIDMDDTGSDSD